MKLACRLALLTVAFGIAAPGCDDVVAYNESCPRSQRVAGESAVPLDVRKATLRSTEAPFGNLIADALLGAAVLADPTVVGAIQNAGAIRPELCEGGEREEIPAGPITDSDVEQLLPFENYLTHVTVSGDELKSVLERGVSSLPEDTEGWFLHVSGITFTADCARQRQVISADGTTIATEGDRVTAISVDGAPWSAAATYRIATNDYVAAGEDGFLALRDASTTATSVLHTDVLKSWLESRSPVSPAIEGRMVLTSACAPAGL